MIVAYERLAQYRKEAEQGAHPEPFHPAFPRAWRTWIALASCPARQRAAAKLSQDVPVPELGVAALAGES
jgi:hypothetical protein